MFKFELKGIDDLYKKLDMEKNQEKAMRMEALETGAKIIADEADSRAPESGFIRVKVKSKEAIIGFDKEKWYWRFFELGAKTHEIPYKAKTKKKKIVKPLVFEGYVGIVRIKSVNHPGMAARPFLRPALDERKDEAIRTMGEIVRKMAEKPE